MSVETSKLSGFLGSLLIPAMSSTGAGRFRSSGVVLGNLGGLLWCWICSIWSWKWWNFDNEDVSGAVDVIQWHLLCPPRACPDEKTLWQMEHSWTLDFLLEGKEREDGFDACSNCCKFEVVDFEGTEKSSWVITSSSARLSSM